MYKDLEFHHLSLSRIYDRDVWYHWYKWCIYHHPRYWAEAMKSMAGVCVSTLGQLHCTVTWLLYLILGLRSLSSCLYHI